MRARDIFLSLAATACVTVSVRFEPDAFLDALDVQHGSRQAMPVPTSHPDGPAAVEVEAPTQVVRGQAFVVRVITTADPERVAAAVLGVEGGQEHFVVQPPQVLLPHPGGAPGQPQRRLDIVATLRADADDVVGETYTLRVGLIDGSGRPGDFVEIDVMVADAPAVQCPEQADCSGRVCGLDPVCAQACGDCTPGSACAYDGQCLPIGACPDLAECDVVECGPDPVCAFDCGACPDGLTCSLDGACEAGELVCGDGRVDGDEECDDGNADDSDACLSDCRSARCGDGVIREALEECDDAGESAACDDDCTAAVCGDGIVNAAAGEACDDGNTEHGDGCNGDCTVSSVAIAIVAGEEHTCALIDTGAVRCWGRGPRGQLGYGDTQSIGDDETPASAGDVELGGAAVELAAGGRHTCALLGDGAVRCWGEGGRGQLGYGDTQSIGDDEVPASAGDVPLGGVAVALAAGGAHTCAVLQSGDLRCWGAGQFGQLGLAATDDIGDGEAPSSVPGVDLGGSAAAVGAGSDHSCAVTTGGAVLCFGLANSGQLGYGNTAAIGDDEDPAAAGPVVLGSVADRVVAGARHSCALLGTSLRCWGDGSSGQLGRGSTATIGDDELPDTGDVVLGASAALVVAGFDHTCALTAAGGVRCFGDGADGRLGYGATETIGDNEDPSSAGDVELGATAVDVAAGGAHSCAVLSDGTVRCWGSGAHGRLGYGDEQNVGDDETPASAGPVPV